MARSGARALYGQIRAKPTGWDQDWTGFGQRFASAELVTVINGNVRYGMEKARHFVLTQHVELLDHSGDAPLDAKSRLQHYAQAHWAATPVYRETSRGTPQQPSFNSRVTVKGRTLGSGSGPSKKVAQQAAAAAALLALQLPA